MRNRQHEQYGLLATELRLAACPLAHVDGHLVDSQVRAVEAKQRLHLGRAARVGLGEDRQRGGVDRVHPARGVEERSPEHEPDRSAKHGGAQTARARRGVAVGGEVLVACESRADRDVADAGANPVEQPAKLGRRVLAVGVDAPAELVSVGERVLVAGCDAGLEPAVLAEGKHLGAVLSGDLRGGVGRAVIDDEHVDVG